jgi:UDP-galactopyranose mutase
LKAPAAGARLGIVAFAPGQAARVPLPRIDRSSMNVDYLIVGSGLSGAVIARTLADAGRSTLIVERRDHAGGNVHGHYHSSGIRIHTYGPHYFRTNDANIWTLVNRFASFCYEKFVKGYTEKQWGVTASALAPNLAKRFELRQDDDPLGEHRYQGIPSRGYAAFMQQLLAGIPVILNWNYLALM